MGNQCNNYFFNEPSLNLAPRTINQVTNAPSNKYALRLKNKFPKLQPHIQEIRSKIKLNGIDDIIRNCPIYFIYDKSAVYQGHWDNGQPHGYGRAVYSDFSYYEGLFKKSQPCTFITLDHHQDGIYIFADGTYYQGEFRDSKFSGKGILVKEGEMKIIGHFKQGLPHGQGIQTLLYYNDEGKLVQSTYQGSFVNGIKQGKGRFEDDKLLYDGQFHNGKPHGDGQLVDYNGIEFKGKFHNGKRMGGQIKSGYGTIRGHAAQKSHLAQGYYEWKDGEKFYVGQIRNDRLDGPGKIYFNNGRVIEGVWKKGHNNHVTKVYQISQNQVIQIKNQHQGQYKQINQQRMSRSQLRSGISQQSQHQQSQHQHQHHNYNQQQQVHSQQQQQQKNFHDYYHQQQQQQQNSSLIKKTGHNHP